MVTICGLCTPAIAFWPQGSLRFSEQTAIPCPNRQFPLGYGNKVYFV